MKHLVVQFIGGIGYTLCGIYSVNVTAYPELATCKRCLKNSA